MCVPVLSLCGMGSDFLHSITFVFLTLSLTQRQDKSVKNNKLIAATKPGQLLQSLIMPVGGGGWELLYEKNQ